MTFEEALKALKEGKKVKRKSSAGLNCIYDKKFLHYHEFVPTIYNILNWDDLSSNDWEIVID